MTRRLPLLPALAALLLASLLLTPSPSPAQGLDMSHGGPVQITAIGGIEWRQAQQMVIARGDARAVRDNVTVLADELIAYYRKKAGAQAAAKGAAPKGTAEAAGSLLGGDSGDNEIYRLVALGHVRIYTPTDFAQGDKAVYDIDQAVLVLTGHNLKLITPQDTLTARDSLEYWSQKHMAVGRGDATVVTRDGRRLSADVLVGYTTPGTQAAQRTTQGAPGAGAAKPQAAADPLAASGKLEKVEAFGNVVIRTATEIVHGDRGIYVPAIQIARLFGHVRITRGPNQLVGEEAEVNLKTGVARLLSNPGQRVEGLVVPEQAPQQGTTGGVPAGAAKGKGKAAGGKG